jgi:nitrite reductase/ring-hydroxylating ferredoxin subunit
MTSTLENRRGPVLSDGTKLSELINFDKREVSKRVLRDPEIYRLELKRIFARSWVAVGHTAEIPNAGDFVTRHIGQDSVIVTRGRDGEVSILLNACSHRGMEVCWADHGNQSNFKCPYHGWAFDTSGNLLGAPFEKEMYGGWDKSQFGLRKARVGIHRGRIFGNFDANAVSLEDWLGDAAYYLELPYGDTDPEMEVYETPRRFRVHANWKISSDNNSGDGYHALTLHRSLTEMGIGPSDVLRGLDVVKVSTAMGHGLYGFPKGIMGAPGDEGDKYSLEGRIFSMMLFPGSFGTGGASNHRMPTADGGSVLVADIGGVVPCGPGVFEMWSARMIEKGAPESVKMGMRAMAPLLDLGGVDDVESWPSIQRAAEGVVAEEQAMRYNAISGVNKPDGWPGPGDVYAGISKDDNQWNFWLRWFDLMTVDEA